MPLPVNPLTGKHSAPYSNDYLQFANNVKQTGSLVPYSNPTITHYLGAAPQPDSDAGGYVAPSGGGGTGGGYVQPAPVADLSLYDNSIQQANNALGGLDQQRDIGLSNIQNGVNSALGTLLGQERIAKRDYDYNRNRAVQGNITARSDIDASTGRQANALQRLLGSRGAGNSDAARIAAPYAAALQGTQQRNQVADAYSENMYGLDTSFRDFGDQVKSKREDVERQRFTQEQGLNASVAEKRANLLNNLAQLQMQRAAAAGGGATEALAAARPYMDQVNALQGQINEFGRQYANPIQVQAPTYAAPDLQQYRYDEGPAAVANESAYTDSISPYLSILRRQRQQGAF